MVLRLRPGVLWQEKPEARRTIRPSGAVVQDLGVGAGAWSPGIDDCADRAGRPLCLRVLRQQPQGERLQQMVSGILLDARDPLHPHPSSASLRAPALNPMDGCGPAAAPRPHPLPRTLQAPLPWTPHSGSRQPGSGWMVLMCISFLSGSLIWFSLGCGRGFV